MTGTSRGSITRPTVRGVLVCGKTGKAQRTRQGEHRIRRHDPLLPVYYDGYVALLLYPSYRFEVYGCVAGRVKRSVPVRVGTETADMAHSGSYID